MVVQIFFRGMAAVALVLGVVTCGVNIFPSSYDAQLGANLDQEIRKNAREYPILQNETVRSSVQNMVNEIIRSPLD